MKEYIEETIPIRLKETRQHFRVQQMEIGKLFDDKHPSAISSYERGRTSITAQNLLRLANFYKIDIRVFYDHEISIDEAVKAYRNGETPDEEIPPDPKLEIEPPSVKAPKTTLPEGVHIRGIIAETTSLFSHLENLQGLLEKGEDRFYIGSAMRTVTDTFKKLESHVEKLKAYV